MRNSDPCRLTELAGEIALICGDLVAGRDRTGFAVIEGDGQRIRIDAEAFIEADPASGRFRLVQDRRNAPRLAIETANRLQLLDYVMGRVTGAAPASPREPPPEMRPLVGCTLESVERALVLATLTRCRGNRTAAARVLGISLRTLRNKLRAYRDRSPPGDGDPLPG